MTKAELQAEVERLRAENVRLIAIIEHSWQRPLPAPAAPPVLPYKPYAPTAAPPYPIYPTNTPIYNTC